MPLHIVNLGSSFAAGPSISPQVDKHALRSGANYAHIIADTLGAKLTDLSVSGATLSNLLDEPQVTLRHTFPPQIQELPSDADVVLVLGGGNDVGYIGGLFVDSFRSYWIINTVLKLRDWIWGSQSTEEPPILTTEGLAERYGVVLDAIHARVPSAAVFVVEYLTVVGPDVKPGIDVPFDEKKLEHHKDMAEVVRIAAIKAVQGRESWCKRILIAEPSLHHGVGSVRPWVSGWGLKLLYSTGAYHPNAEGMEAVADIILPELAGIKTSNFSGL